MVVLQKVDLDKEEIIFEDWCNKLWKHKPKKVLGKHKSKSDTYSLPLNYWTLSLFRNEAGIATHGNKLLTEYDNKYKELAYWKSHSLHQKELVEEIANRITINEEVDKILYPYQKIDAYLMATNESFANLNCMRSGKTFTTCAAMELIRQQFPKQKIIISIIQATNKQWCASIKKICPLYKIIDLSEQSNKKLRAEGYNDFVNTTEACVLIVNRDKLKLDMNFKTPQNNYILSKKDIQELNYGFITDEVHFTRNINTEQSLCHFYLSTKAQWRWGLTGTKLSNIAADLYGLLKYLEPWKYNSITKFRERYLIEDKVYVGHVTFREWKRMNPDTQHELFGILFMLSVERTEKEVLNWVPEMQELEPVLLEMEKEQQEIYSTLFETMELEIEKEESNNEFISVPNHLALRTKLLQVATSQSAILKDTTKLSNKEQWIVDYLKENAEYGIKPVIFGRFSTTILIPFAKKLEKIINPQTKKPYKVGLITGQTESKSDVQDNWQKGKYDILICNIKSGGVGLTLDYGDVAIFMERDDDFASNEQAKKRIMNTKKDDERIKQIIHLITMHPWSVDLIQYASQQQKEGWVLEMYPDKMTKQLIEWEKLNSKIIKERE